MKLTHYIIGTSGLHLGFIWEFGGENERKIERNLTSYWSTLQVMV